MDAENLGHLSPEFRDDKKFILEAMDLFMTIQQQDLFIILWFASAEVFRDQDFILRAMKISDQAIHFAPKEVFRDVKYVIKAMEIDYTAVQFASTEVLDSDKFIMEATEIYDKALKFASERLRSCRKVALAASKTEGGFEFVAESLRSNFDFMLEVVRQTGDAVRFAAPNLRSRKDFFRVAIPTLTDEYEIYNCLFYGDEDLILAATDCGK